jgi:hypothetical protein
MPYKSYFKESHYYTNCQWLVTNFDTVRADDDEVHVTSYFQNGNSYPDTIRKLVSELSDEHGEGYKDFFQGLKTKVIPLHKIVPTQPFLSQKKLCKKYDSESTDLPEFIFYKGKYFLLDGHHRVASKIRKGGLIKGVVFFIKG